MSLGYNHQSFKDKDCAYVIIYNSGRNDFNEAIITINDSSELVLQKESLFRFKVIKEGEYKIASDRNTINIAVKFGTSYYVKGSFFHRKSNLSVVDSVEGELESSLMKEKHYVNMDR